MVSTRRSPRVSAPVPTVPDTQSVVAVVDARTARDSGIEPGGGDDPTAKPLSPLLDEDSELQHVARTEVDLAELATLTAIEGEVPFPVPWTHAERPEQHLLGKNRQRLSCGAFDDPADRDDPARAVAADGARSAAMGKSTKALAQSAVS